MLFNYQSKKKIDNVACSAGSFCVLVVLHCSSQSSRFASMLAYAILFPFQASSEFDSKMAFASSKCAPLPKHACFAGYFI